MKDPIIKAKSKEEDNKLREAYQKLENHYEVRTDFGSLEVKRFLDSKNIVSVYPHEKEARIKDITRKSRDLGGLLKNTSEFCLIEFRGKRYDIQYRNPSNQNYSQE